MSIICTATNNTYINDLYSHISTVIPDIYKWTPHQRSLYSILDKGKSFDYLFCEAQHLTPATIEAINEYHIKVITFGYLENKNIHPSVKCLLLSDIEPLFPHDFTNYLYLAPAANIRFLHPCQLDNSKNGSVWYISDKDDDIIKYLIDNNISVKIAGPNRLPYNEYLGTLDTPTRMKIFSEAKVVILNSIEYMYDVGLSQSYALIKQENILYPDFQSKEDLLDLIKEFNNTNYVEQVIPLHKKKALELSLQDTFYHRIIEIFTRLERSDIVELCQKHL